MFETPTDALNGCKCLWGKGVAREWARRPGSPNRNDVLHC